MKRSQFWKGWRNLVRKALEPSYGIYSHSNTIKGDECMFGSMIMIGLPVLITVHLGMSMTHVGIALAIMPMLASAICMRIFLFKRTI